MVLLHSTDPSTVCAWSTQIFPVCWKPGFVLSLLLGGLERMCWAPFHSVATSFVLCCGGGAHGSVCFGAWEPLEPFYSKLRAEVAARIPFTTTLEWPEQPELCNCWMAPANLCSWLKVETAELAQDIGLGASKEKYLLKNFGVFLPFQFYLK